MKVIYESYLRRHRNNNNNHNNNNGHNIEICHPNDYSKNSSNRTNNGDSLAGSNCRHIISVDSLVINKELGVGEFGVVQQGVWTNEDGRRTQVAIKCLSAARLENNRLEFLKEATIMHSISNEHIVTLYGVVLEPSIMLVTELAPLRSMLECLKEPTLISHFPVTSLCLFAAQIADGMSYLESKRFIHRDLAARNILVFSKNKVKISDFGLSRALGVGKDYYQSNFNVNLKLPIAWCAPECINYLKFTSQSDVWAYGVTLWEMFSFGFQPWAALTGQQILEAIDKPNYQRLEQPECCPKEYYQLMVKCWTHDPHMRPKFSEIVNILPDCKPELLQAIRNSESGSNRKDYLPYKVGDIVTVIEKTNSDTGDTATELFWKGVTNDRKTGLFNPSDFVAYLGQNLPSSNNSSSSSSSTFMQQFLSGNSSSSNSNSHHSNSHNSLASTITSTVLQSSKFIRGFLESKSHQNNHSSPHGSRKSRLRPEMISKPQEGNYHQLSRNTTSGSLDGNENKLKLPNSHPITSFSKSSSNMLNSKVVPNYLNENHEYHEISDEDDMEPLESPPFEVLDFGPSLMEEVFRELDQIKPDLNNEAGESETAMNECGINVKNEVRELNLKITKEANNSKKKQSTVKAISEAEQNELDSAIAMAKDIASRTMLDDDLDITKNDSPKTPNSPNKRKFSFKFPSHKSSPKSERRTFCEETESIGNIIESITPAAKEAYLTLVDKGVSNCNSNATNTVSASKEMFDMRPDAVQPSSARQSINISQPQIIGTLSQMTPSPGSLSTNNLVNEIETNPLRMLRTAGIGKVLRPKVRGNRSFSQPRLPTTAQTACIARVASSRSQLGSPPPVPNHDDQSLTSQAVLPSLSNALPLPPRDRSRPLIQLKTHQRRHPLVIPAELTCVNDNVNGHGSIDEHHNDFARHESPPMLHRPVLKQVSCPQAPAAFLQQLSGYNKTNQSINSTNNTSDLTSNDCDKLSAPLPPPKPNRTYLSEDLTESLENEIQKAFDNIKLNQYNNSEVNNGVQEDVKPEKDLVANTVTSVIVTTSIPIKASYVSITNTQSEPHQISNGAVNAQDNLVTPPNTELTQVNGTLQAAIDKRPQLVINKVNEVSTNVKRTGDEVHVMQKVLSNEINLSEDECVSILDSAGWDIHKAIKCVRLRLQLQSHNITGELDWAQVLTKFNWNLRMASNYMIATQGVPGDTTEV